MRHPTPAELHRLFQARVWREYAMAWDGRKTMTGVGREWAEKVLRVSRAECLRRARAALMPDGGRAPALYTAPPAEPVAAVAWVSEFFKKHGFYPSPAQAYAAGSLTAPPAMRAPLTELEAAYLAQEADLRIITREETAALMRLVRFVEAAVSGGITQEHRR